MVKKRFLSVMIAIVCLALVLPVTFVNNKNANAEEVKAGYGGFLGRTVNVLSATV